MTEQPELDINTPEGRAEIARRGQAWSAATGAGATEEQADQEMNGRNN